MSGQKTQSLERIILHTMAVVALLSSAALAAAFLFEYVGGLRPCVLCIYQRWPHVLIILSAGLAVLLVRRGARAYLYSGVSLVLALAGALVGAGLALYHAGIERHWWPGHSGCTSPLGANSVEDLRALLLSAPLVRCDDVVWSFLGLSMADYNVMLSLVLSVLCLFALYCLRSLHRHHVRA